MPSEIDMPNGGEMEVDEPQTQEQMDHWNCYDPCPCDSDGRVFDVPSMN
jgi:hypothetical protein